MIFTIIGNFGVFLIILAYLMLQLEKVTATSKKYLLLNIAGSALIIVSLLVKWNTPAFMIEFFWILISVFGLLKPTKNKE